jgi:hypothetical protein
MFSKYTVLPQASHLNVFTYDLDLVPL